jgi:mannose-6-phosphate isomerase
MDDHLSKILHDERPWGSWRRFAFNESCTVKIITVAAGGILSLQRHAGRDELWHILDDGLRLEIDGVVHTPKPGDEFMIMRGSTHRLSSLGPSGRVLEVGFGDFDEDDIERLDDAYGRSSP